MASGMLLEQPRKNTCSAYTLTCPGVIINRYRYKVAIYATETASRLNDNEHLQVAS